MKRLPAGLTFLEVLIVVALIGVISIPLYLSYTRAQANQGLTATSEIFATVAGRAHLFSREAKDQKQWGVKRQDEHSFALINGKPDSWALVSTNKAEPFVSIPDDFLIWFDIGTGQTDTNHTVVFQTEFGRKVEVTISKSAVIEKTTVF